MNKIFVFGIIILSLASCKKESIKTNEASGNLEFTFSLNKQKSADSNNILSNENSLSALVIVIEDENGNLVKDYEKIEFFNLNGYYISKPISLLVGNYTLTQFMVLDQNDSIVYLSPMQNSPKAYLVTNPLPLEFSINKDITNKIVPEVLSTKDLKPEDFGYSTFAFDVVETFDFLIGAFIYNESITNYELTTANIQIFADSLLVYNGDLGSPTTDSIIANIGKTNQINLPERYNSFNLKVTKQGFSTYEKTFTKDELKLHFLSSDKGPLMVILEKVAQDDGLVAFYPFNGNADDYSGYSNHGELFGSTLTTNRFDSIGAYGFDGIDDYIMVNNSSSLNPTDAITLCAWVRPVSFLGKGNSGIIDKGYYNHSNPYYQYHLGITGDQYPYHPNSFQLSLSIKNNYEWLTAEQQWVPNNWYLVTGTYDGTKMKLFVNGELQLERTISGTIDNFNEPIYIGATQNSPDNNVPGKIDDVRIYNRALSAGEIKLLYDSGK
jgi:hypothetical protein